eukprot:TRINITY_DN47091_c0_g1_i1.p1 TRINITY_DN47091_c0_g1~~TRINITY_DN47091_c0_g1_i1.p1  ORF type:complete len:931 (+),score=255.22 TRINITY_DN47091_c0_g1_i1:67-2859(+)
MPGTPQRRDRSAGYSTRTPGSYSTPRRGQEPLWAVPGRKAQEQSENARRVQKRKVERKFMAEISSGGGYRLGELQKLIEDDQERRSRIAAGSPQRSPRQQRSAVQPPPEEPIRCAHEFSGSIRCLELTQGGATLWTGDNDGTLSIRNGATGEIVHHIPASCGLYADSLFATDTHIWVGMNDGTVRIYDHLVYILASEAKFHSGSVTCFATTFDGKIFSGSTDSNVIKWDSEANKFERMAKLMTTGGRCVHCMDCYGYNLFVGSDDGVIRCLDTETGEELRRCEGHTGGIRALLVQDGYLFSGSLDCTVRAWNIEFAECIWVMGKNSPSRVGHTDRVTALVGDQVAHRIWSADASSNIHIWDSLPDQDFAHRGQLRHSEAHDGQQGAPVIVLKSYCTVDAIKLWSLAANGKNLIWSSAVNKVEDAVHATTDAMSGIINQDMVELRRWQDLIRKLEAIDERRKTELAHSLGTVTHSGSLRTYFQKWLRWVAVSHHVRGKRLVCELLARSTERGLLRSYYERLDAHATRQKMKSRRSNTARGLLQVHSRGLQQIYWRKIKAYVIAEKHRRNGSRMCDALRGTSDAVLRRVFWRKWLRWLQRVARARRHHAALENLMRCTNRGILAVCYARLRSRRQAKLAVSQCDRLMTAQAFQCFRALLRRYYARLKLAHRHRRRRRIITDALWRSNDRIHQARVYGIWRAYYHSREQRRLAEQLQAVKEDHEDLSKQYSEREAKLSRYKDIEDKKKEAEAARKKGEAVDAEIDAMEQELRELEEKIQAKRAADQERVAVSKQKMVEDFMAILKSKTLNYHRDYDMITKLRDGVEPQGSQSVVKVFLKAHMVVKRVVVEITGEKQEPGDRWRGLDAKIGSVQDHHKRTVLTAIKEMIVCFDLMTEAMKSSLDTDDEIIHNAQFLSILAEQGRVLEERRYGRY